MEFDKLSNNHFFLYLSSIIKTMQGVHVLKGINIYGNNFPKNIDNLIGTISKITEVPKEKLDYTSKSINDIDYFLINNQEKITEEFFNRYLMYFIAYAGEVYIHNYGGEWENILYKDGETWVPYIRTENSKLFDLFIWIYESLSQDEILTLGNGYFPVIPSGSIKK